MILLDVHVCSKKTNASIAGKYFDIEKFQSEYKY